MKKLIALLLAALLMMSFACAEEITAVDLEGAQRMFT